jgi:hypothetical protein
VREPNTSAILRRSFTSEDRIQAAQLTGVADFCHMIVRLNGQKLTEAEGYASPFQLDVLRAIRPGPNVLEVAATGTQGPSAVALRLEMTTLAGEKQLVVTDSAWSSELIAAGQRREWPQSADLGEVREFELDPRRQFGIVATDDY